MSQDQLSDFDFQLPSTQIAQTPAQPRDSARLMVLHREQQKWEHRIFRELPEFLDSRDLLVANNTQVIKARLLGYRLRREKNRWVAGGKVEFFLLEQIQPRIWEGLFHASAKYVAGLQFKIPTPDGQTLHGTLIRGSKDSPHGIVVAEFDRDPLESQAGQVPLPPYIERPLTPSDEKDYQTIYSKIPGSAAAPTAGLHFTETVLDDLKRKGVSWAEITLHIGLGTFRPVKEEEISKHQMHEEKYEISPQVAQQILDWKTQQKRVAAVGTTCVRALESAWISPSEIKTGIQKTSIFIRPGQHKFQLVDRLLTNFHLPQSTLLMLVSAFAGYDFLKAAYKEAIQKGYRFFSYGDSMLIL